MKLLTETQILERLAGGPGLLVGDAPRAVYFDLEARGLITMTEINPGPGETVVRVEITEKGRGRA